MKFCDNKYYVQKRWRNYPIWRYSIESFSWNSHSNPIQIPGGQIQWIFPDLPAVNRTCSSQARFPTAHQLFLPGKATLLPHEVGQGVVPISCFPLGEEDRVRETHSRSARHPLYSTVIGHGCILDFTNYSFAFFLSANEKRILFAKACPMFIPWRSWWWTRTFPRWRGEAGPGREAGRRTWSPRCSPWGCEAVLHHRWTSKFIYRIRNRKSENS